MTPLLHCHYQWRYGRLVGAVRWRLLVSRAAAGRSLSKDAPELPGATARRSAVGGRENIVAPRSFSTAKPCLPPSSNAFVLLKLYNSLSGIQEPVVVASSSGKNQDAAALGIACYTCGPTVYAPSHLGHARTYVWLDILRRTLQQQQQAQTTHQPSATASSSTQSRPAPPPLFVMNITDVDDKILAAAAANNNSNNNNHSNLSSTPLDLARHYEAEFWNDWDALHCLRPHVVMRVSEHVESDIVPYIQRLMDQGVAYEMIRSNNHGVRSAASTCTENLDDDDDEETEGGVYFDTQAYEQLCRVEYGNWFRRKKNENSNNDVDDDCESTTREEAPIHAFFTATTKSKESTNRKRDRRDFALWKHRKRGEALYWASPWGPGRPGWHIECSAMLDSVRRQFQDTHTFALHAGGVDLQFPHHTNEIAQAEAHRHDASTSSTTTTASNTTTCCGNNHDGEDPWIPHWIHTGHLKIDGLKMSKSLKNFISIQDWLDQAAAAASAGGGTHNPRAAAADDFRLWCLGLSGSYRKTATFSYQRLQEAHNVRVKLVQFLIQGEEWLVQKEPTTTKRGSRHCDSKKYCPRDHALLTKVHEAAALGRRAMVEMDLDGTTFVKQLVVVAEAGMSHLRQDDNGDGELGPTEPVQACLDVLRDMLQQVGFSDTTYRAGITTSERQSHNMVASPECGDLQTPLNRALLDELTRFRSLVRRAAMDDLPIHPSAPGSANALCGLNQRILTACDDLRSSLPSLGVELLDARVSAENGRQDDWRFCVPRASPLSSDSTDNASSLKQYDTNVSQVTPTSQKRSITPQNLFQADPRYEGMFSAFNPDGIPTRNADGSEVSKTQQKKYRKKQAKHAQLLESNVE